MRQIEQGAGNDFRFNWIQGSIGIIFFALQQSVSDGYSIKMSFLLPLLNRLESEPNQVAANSLGLMLANVLFITLAAPMFAVNAEISREFVLAQRRDILEEQRGASDEKILRTVTSAVLYGAVATVPATTSLVFSSTILQTVFQQDQYISDHAQTFLRMFAIAVPATLYVIGSQQVAFSAKKMRVIVPGALILIASLLSATGLGLGLVGMPQMGKSAILVAYISEAYLSALLYFAFLKCSEKLARFTFFTKEFLSFRNTLNFLKLGGWTALTVFCQLMFGFGLTAMAARFSVEEQAAVGLTYNSLWINTFAAIKFSLAGMVTLGRAKGRLTGVADRAQARNKLLSVAANGVVTTALFCAVIPFIFAFRPYLILSIFGHTNRSVQKHIDTIAPFFAAGFCSDALSFALLFQARMLGDYTISGIFRAGSFIIGAGLSALFSMQMNMGIQGLALGYLIGMLCSALSMFVRWGLALKRAFPDQEHDNMRELQTVLIEKNDNDRTETINMHMPTEVSDNNSPQIITPRLI